MRKLLNKIVHLFLSERKILDIKNRHSVPSMEWTLFNLKSLGFTPDFSIDVGAYEGKWTEMFRKIFPSSKILMVEAQHEKEAALKLITDKLPGTYYHIGLLGAESGKEVVFNKSETVSSVLEEYKTNDFEKETMRIETLDDVVSSQNNNLKSPDFIKLDVQGYELEVLKGASKCLKSAQFILCEVSLLEINKGCPLFYDVIKFMDTNGFITYDICSFIRRPLDKALWQTDLLFIKKDHPLIQNKHWD